MCFMRDTSQLMGLLRQVVNTRPPDYEMQKAFLVVCIVAIVCPVCTASIRNPAAGRQRQAA